MLPCEWKHNNLKNDTNINSLHADVEMPDADHPDYSTDKTLDDVEKQAEDRIYQQALPETTQLINQD